MVFGARTRISSAFCFTPSDNSPMSSQKRSSTFRKRSLMFSTAIALRICLIMAAKVPSFTLLISKSALPGLSFIHLITP